MGEAGVDEGGLRREFFRLLGLSVQEKYFQGREDHKFFVQNISAIVVSLSCTATSLYLLLIM